MAGPDRNSDRPQFYRSAACHVVNGAAISRLGRPGRKATRQVGTGAEDLVGAGLAQPVRMAIEAVGAGGEAKDGHAGGPPGCHAGDAVLDDQAALGPRQEAS